MDRRRGAPNKKGLSYFPKAVDFYDDDRIFDLLEEYGPKGVTIYDVILTIVYSHGYYVELSKAKLSKMVIRKIGNRWVKQRDVEQVIQYCADIGLLDDGLLAKSVVTSVGIQTRYQEIALKQLKRRLYNDKYWLLDDPKNEEPLLKSPSDGINSEENRINSEENRLNSESSHTEIKENKSIYIIYDNQDLNRIFNLYISMRNGNQKTPLTDEQIRILKEELDSVADNDADRIAICKKAYASGWKSFYPIGKKKQKNSFHNFDQRDYDYEMIEKRLTGNDKT